MELVLKTQPVIRAAPKPQQGVRMAQQKLLKQETTIVFKREDFVAADKQAVEKEEVLRAKVSGAPSNAPEESLLSGKTYASLALCEHLHYKLEKQLQLTQMTQIQAQSYEAVYGGQNCFLKAATGSGKTLAFLVPILNRLIPLLQETSMTRQDTYMLVVSPTRELSQQTEGLVRALCNSTRLVVAGLSGGAGRDAEKVQLRKGANIICATPGRLRDHLDSTQAMRPLLAKVSVLVLDECDALLVPAHSSTLDETIRATPQNAQKVFVSATIPEHVQRFAQRWLKDPRVIQTKDMISTAFRLPDGLRQQFLNVNPKTKLPVLAALLATLPGRTLVFAESQAVCVFLQEILGRVARSLGIFKVPKALHGGVPAEQRVKIWKEYLAEGGILVATDVSARGLNLGAQDAKMAAQRKEKFEEDELDVQKAQVEPDGQDILSGVDCVIQYEAPASIEQYVHRAGRAARIGQAGTNFLFLQPHELGFLDFVVEQTKQMIEYHPTDTVGVAVAGFDNPIRLFEKLQAFAEVQVKDDRDLKELAIQAYQSYIAGYRAKDASVRSCFSKDLLHLGHVAKSFGLIDPPSKLAGQTKRAQEEKFRRHEYEKSSERTRRNQQLEQRKKGWKKQL